jgi:hypothetical protein
MIRGILLTLILAIIGLTAGGYIADALGVLPEKWSNLYSEHFSFVTGIASVIGLLAFASSRKIKSTDFDSEELEKFKSLMETAEELEAIEENKNQTAKDLQDLERKKKVMEVSVKKAGLVLFYRDQNKRHTEYVKKALEDDPELKKSVAEIIEAQSRIKALNEEIESDENVEIIRDILEESLHDTDKTRKDPVEELLEDVGKLVVKSVNNIFRI